MVDENNNKSTGEGRVENDKRRGTVQCCKNT